MVTHRFWIEVEVQDDMPNANDAEWWADAATGACDEYGAEESTFYLADPGWKAVGSGLVAQGDATALDLIAEMLRDPDWGAGMLEDIAEIVTKTGRTLDNPTGQSTWDRH